MPSESQLRILRALARRPFASRQFLETFLNMERRNLQLHLQHLQAGEWVRRFNGRLVGASAHSLWTITTKAIPPLAEAEGVSPAELARLWRLDHTRLEWLALALPRVYRVRDLNVRLDLAHLGWSPEFAEVEVALELTARQRALVVPLHGVTLLRNAQNWWLALAIEWDTATAPVMLERTRLARLCEGQWDERFFAHPEGEAFPVLVILAADSVRLTEYQRVLASLWPIMRHLPRTFFITQSQLADFWRDPHAALWQTEASATPVPFLAGVPGTPLDLRRVLPLQPWPRRVGSLRIPYELQPLAPAVVIGKRSRDLAELTLALHQLDKWLLKKIGAQPLLTAKELGFLARFPARSVRRALTRLSGWQLIEARTAPTRRGGKYYVLAERGIWVLAASASFGLAVARFAHFRGWANGFERLVNVWEHTRLENAVFLALTREARQRGHAVTWECELEARMNLDAEGEFGPHPLTGRRRTGARRAPRREVNAETSGDTLDTVALSAPERQREWTARGQRVHRYLPDGQGIYATRSGLYVLTLEVDRTRANVAKILDKLHYYFIALVREAFPRWHILVVTSGWERARHWGALNFAVAQNRLDEQQRLPAERRAFLQALAQSHQLERFAVEWVLPLWVTTEAAFCEQGIASPIWLRGRDWACLDADLGKQKRLEMWTEG